MALVVEIRAVVADDHHAWKSVVNRSPHRSVSHEEVAVAAESDDHTARAFEREPRADGDAGARADATAAVEADVFERVAEVRIRAVPAERKTRDAAIDAVGCGLQR